MTPADTTTDDDDDMWQVYWHCVYTDPGQGGTCKADNNEGQSANIILATARLFHPFSAHGLVPHIQTMQMFSLQSDIWEIDSETGCFIAKVQYGSRESISSFNFNPLIQAYQIVI